MATAELSGVVQQVFDLSRQVLVQSKHLADLINVEGTTEDAIIEAAKQTAGITAQLYNVLVEGINSNGSPAENQLRTSVLSSAREVRTSILDLIQSTKDALLNPFDFQATQKVQNCCVTVANNIKEVISQVQALEALRQTGSSGGVTDPDAEKVKTCAALLKALVETATAGGQQQDFLEAAKKFAAAFAAIIELATSKNETQLIESMKESAQSLLTAAKTVFKSPQDTIAREALEISREKILNSMRELSPTPALLPPPPRAASGSSLTGDPAIVAAPPPSALPMPAALPSPMPVTFKALPTPKRRKK